MQKLIDLVLDEIVRDVTVGDLTAIEELLRAVPKDALIGYLPEDIGATNEYHDD